MQGNDALEYMCPYCGFINNFKIAAIRDMYQEQETSCNCCRKTLNLTPANGIGGRINLIVDSVETDKPVILENYTTEFQEH